VRKYIHLKIVGSKDFTSAVTSFPFGLDVLERAPDELDRVAVAGSAARRSDQATSSAVKGEPSCQVTPSRTTMRTLVRSSFQPHSVRRPGAG
jgi:hypothetical protein